MPPTDPLPAARLRRTLDPAELAPAFETTRELEALSETVGQERAVEALRFGLAIRHDGYNLFVSGPPGTDRHAIVRQHVEQRAKEQPVPDDCCYIHDFEHADRPRVLLLPAGTGARLRGDLDAFVEEVQSAIQAAFDREEYRVRAEGLAAEHEESGQKAFAALAERAHEKGCVLLQTPTGMVLAPARDGEVLEPDEFQKLPKEEQERLRKDLAALTEELRAIVKLEPQRAREHRRAMRELDRETARIAVTGLIDELRARYAEHPAVAAHLDAVADDVLRHADRFRHRAPHTLPEALAMAQAAEGVDAGFLQRYRVNLLVDHAASHGAPVVAEDRPSHDDLLGRVEHVAQLGALVTNFMLVKAGALHRARGGYLILDAAKVLTQPLAWEALKRALRSRELRIESIGRQLGLVATVSLEPEPIPLDVKVVLVGERHLHHLLSALDPEFRELFKVVVDLDDRAERTPDNVASFARLLATAVRTRGWRELDRAAVARAIEHAARLAGDASRLSTRLTDLFDLVREADHWAGEAGRDVVTAADVERALEAQVRRGDRLRERLQEEIRRGTLHVDVEGATAGQVNALKVVDLGGFAFGLPGRVSARAFLGDGGVLDIEREVELGGPTHSKGVLILSGFIGGRYGGGRPLALSATLVFEQSYGPVDGDSASLAELCALLSALTGVPLRQSLALTGSVDQHGAVQAIGGVNEKIEGFFDVCSARGLTGEQGVLIPAANVEHLMLRPDVVAAAAEGRFRIWPVAHFDQAIEHLTGLEAGARGPDGTWPAGSFNRAVADSLDALADRARAFASDPALDAAREQQPGKAP